MAGAVSEPAWKTKPSYYLVASDDKMIPPPAQRKMAERAKARVTEVAGSHAVYVSKPHAVAEIRGASRYAKRVPPSLSSQPRYPFADAYN
jgi:pimeloyl-ACP methyl ester carboxylesterase